jgi:MFS family permease
MQSSFEYFETIFSPYDPESGLSEAYQIAMAVSTILAILAGFSFFYWQRLLKRWLAAVSCLLVVFGLLALAVIAPNMIIGVIGSALARFGVTLAIAFLLAGLVNATPPQRLPLTLVAYSAAQAITVFSIGIINNMIMDICGDFRGPLLFSTILVGIVALGTALLAKRAPSLPTTDLPFEPQSQAADSQAAKDDA